MSANTRSAGGAWRTVTAAAVAVVTLLGTAACGGDEDAADAEPVRGLSGALAGIPQDRAENVFTYWDVSQLRPLIKGDQELYGPALSSLGIAELEDIRYEEELTAREVFGFDETQVETAVHIDGDSARLTGRFDVSAVTDAMKKNGWTESKTDGGALFASGESKVAVSSTVRSRTFVKDVVPPPLAAPEKSLLADPAYRAVADCVGDGTYFAFFHIKNYDTHLPGLTLFAVGGHAADDGTSRERLCALTESPEGARTVADALRTETAAGERYAGASVEVGDGPTPMVTMEWANSMASGLKPGGHAQTQQLSNVLSPLG
ncbi:hypothetical protein AB0D49_20825 [Streptomyces sp. NPDC048290]|uniref:hypothetical protein n=1 Tax=Streptomyces sp. NPDC048290 TaxID=3155811 RepID=UPI003430F148